VVFYRESIPISHFLSVIAVLGIIFLLVTTNVLAFLGVDNNTLIEGVIMGVNSDGKTQPLTRVNPLINTNIQLEKDLSDLIYNSLITIDTHGEPKADLATFFVLEEGKRYQFKLKPDLYWQDGQKLTVDDVVATFNLIKSLESNPQTSNIYSRAANKMDIVKSDTDPDVFEFVVKGDNVVPGFFEAISFKIMPAHLLADLNPDSITKPDPYINRHPVGSGPYEFVQATGDTVDLVANSNYYGGIPKISNIRFKLFGNEQDAVSALLTGQIHSLTGISDAGITAISQSPNIDLQTSNVIYNQYWGIYFNLADSGPAPLKDMQVRQSIAMGIDKDAIITAMLGYAEKAHGPIPVNSFAYSAEEKFSLDVPKAKTQLTNDGWTLNTDNADQPRSKKDASGNIQYLSFDLTVVNDKDRVAVANIISADLKQIGVQINVVPTDLQTIINEDITPRSFDLLFYGVQTLIDPDRYELFDSAQIQQPGLNISSYTSAEKRTQVVDGKTVQVAAVDDDLNDARRIIDQAARSKRYQDFEKIIAEEVPVVFLFHPKEVYAVNKRVHGINLTGINAIEQRFNSIEQWTISVN
jgi:peptide/nickel transport system substrate-binding protein